MRHYSESAHQTVNTTCVIPKSNTETFCLKSLHTGKSESLLAALSSQAPLDFIKSVGLQPFSNLSGGIQPRSDLGSCSAAQEYFTEWSWTHSLFYWKLSLPPVWGPERSGVGCHHRACRYIFPRPWLSPSFCCQSLSPHCDAATTRLHCRDSTVQAVPVFLQTWPLGFRPGLQALFNQRTVFLVWESFWWLWSNRLSCAFHPGVSLLRPFCPDQSAWPGSQL